MSDPISVSGENLGADVPRTSPIALAFVTDDPVERQICIAYWEIDPTFAFVNTVAALAQAAGKTPSAVTSLVRRACVANSAEDVCSTCGKPRITFRSRAEFLEWLRTKNYFPRTSRSCSSCQEAQRIAIERTASELRRQRVDKLNAALEAQRRRYLWRDPRSLAFDDAIYLVSLFRAGASEDLSYIAPHGHFANQLSPSASLDQRILNQLYERGVIAIHPGSHAEALNFEGDELSTFYPMKVHWILPSPEDGPSPARYLETLETLLNDRESWPNDWAEETVALRQIVALEECLEYLRVCLDEHGFELRCGEKLTMVMRSILEKFSLGQTYNFIWRAARDVAAFYLRESVSKNHAVNIVPGTLQRMAERAIAEGWSVKPYRRDRRVPESQLSHVLFTMAMRLPDGGFGATVVGVQNSAPTSET